MPTKSEIFVLEFVLSFGFLGGFLVHFGVDPAEAVIKDLLKAAISGSDLLVFLLIILIGLAITAIGVLGIYADTGKLGLIVVCGAWISGLIMPIGGYLTVVGVFLLVGAVLLEPVVYDIHNN